MRIISGKYRGFKLKLVNSELTRETSDKIRGAVFNSLAVKVNKARVLDLFAGSGAYGLEAISRGALSCVFNDLQSAAVKTINENIDHLKVMSQSEVFNLDYSRLIKQLKDEHQACFDLIFLDPPYQFNEYEKLIDDLEPLGTEKLIIVCEVDLKTTINDTIYFEVFKQAKYGNKQIIYLERR
jgi:16S rRNA (guanine(966)-N(2))-methyltransferase RsmD